jgi:hypothetical protein
MAFNVEGWEGLEAPYASGARRPEGLPGMAGVRDDFQQRVERRTPSVAGQMRFHGAEAVGGTGLGCGGAMGSPFGTVSHDKRDGVTEGR